MTWVQCWTQVKPWCFTLLFFIATGNSVLYWLGENHSRLTRKWYDCWYKDQLVRHPTPECSAWVSAVCSDILPQHMTTRLTNTSTAEWMSTATCRVLTLFMSSNFKDHSHRSPNERTKVVTLLFRYIPLEDVYWWANVLRFFDHSWIHTMEPWCPQLESTTVYHIVINIHTVLYSTS